MARHATPRIEADTWTQLTDANVTAITFQNLAVTGVHIMATVGAVAPTNFAGAVFYAGGHGEYALPLADLAPGLAATRVYCYSPGKAANVAVSHA